MAAQTHGTAYLYGITGVTLASAVVQSASLSKTDKLNVFVQNETGQVVASRHDDQADEITIEAIVEAGITLPNIAASATYNAVAYRITSVVRNESNTDFQRYTITGVKDEYLTLS